MTKDLSAIFSPRSIAVIGASRQENSIGWQVLDNIIRYGYTGMVFPVNPKADVIHSMKCYPSVLDLPGDIDLAIVVVPKQFVAGVMDDCGKKGVKGAIVITAGFKETGGDGIELEKRVLETARKYGISMIGPNCMGMINTNDATRMNATFAPTISKKGNMAFITQSGALGIAILEYIDELNMGISKFVSIGNRADISVNDLLEYLENDDDTRIILLYLESFGNPLRFTPIAKRITKTKPIIAVKAGRTTAGARAASSHTGALAGADIAVDALFEETGVIRATSVEELFDFALAFMMQPAPKGRGVAIVTNGGGPGILATDACISLGLHIAEFGDDTKRRLREFLPKEASVNNPVDLIASANQESYNRSLQIILEDEAVDALIAIFIPPLQTDPLAVADAISRVADKFDKPVLGVFMGREDVLEGVQHLEGRKIPVYLFPESAAKSLLFMAHYEEMRMREDEHGPDAKLIDVGKVEEILSPARRNGRSNLDLMESVSLLDACGIPTLGSEIAANPDAAGKAAERLGFPVAIKIVSSAPELSHKSDYGGVQLGLADAGSVAAAAASMVEKASALLPEGRKDEVQGILVQRMAPEGKEVVIGMKKDPLFGPLIMFGLGGIFVEVMKDVSFKIAPVTHSEAREMMTKIKGYQILKGVRGQPAVDTEAIADAIVRVSQLALSAMDITELDINPIIARPGSGCVAIDARVSLAKND